MTNEDKKEFMDIWRGAWEAVGQGQKATTNMIAFAYQILTDFELSDIKRALVMHARNPDTGQFGPKPADIVKMIQGTGDEKSLKAWTKVEYAVRSVGAWVPICFDDPAIHCCIEEMGGWSKITASDESTLKFMQNEFVKRYKAYTHNPPSMFPAMIKGDGGHDDEPVLIGDPEKAKQVMLLGGESNKLIQKTTQAGLLASLYGGALEDKSNEKS